jgi:4-alpha-glucanotransferase
VDKRSVETWLYPDLFRMNVSIGAPPDQFDPKGQNWDFPSYNWEAMAADGYAWWRRRLQHLAQ